MVLAYSENFLIVFVGGAFCSCRSAAAGRPELDSGNIMSSVCARTGHTYMDVHCVWSHVLQRLGGGGGANNINGPSMLSVKAAFVYALAREKKKLS